MKELRAIVRALTAPDFTSAVLATLVTVDGSSYRRPGARLLINDDASTAGTISGGCLEADVLGRALRVKHTGEAEVVVYDTTSENDLVWGVGLGCHGVVRVLLERIRARPEWAATLATHFALRRATTVEAVYEPIRGRNLGTRLAKGAATEVDSDPGVFVQSVPPPTRLVVFGAGDDAKPLVRLAHELGWEVVVCDPRAAFATRERFPDASTLLVRSADQLVNAAGLDAHCIAVVMTHHYVHDVPILRGLLPHPLPYLGLLGPRKRAERILDDLARSGLSITPEMRHRLHAPVGLDLGADGPEQVALSILAEIQAVLTGRTARPLRERRHPIHALDTTRAADVVR